MTWDFDSYRFDRDDDRESEPKKSEILQNRRQHLFGDNFRIVQLYQPDR